MRVLFVSQRLPPEHVSGAPLQALRLARALAEEEIEVAILTARFTAGQRTGALEIEGVRAHRLPTIPGLSGSYAALAAAFVRSRDFELIHGHALSATALGAAFAARSPVLLKPSLGGPSGDLAKIRRSPLAPILQRVLERIDRFAVVQPRIGAELREIGIPAQRLIAAKNGVDLERFRPDGPKAELGTAGPVVLFVGRPIHRKRLDLLLQAWLQIARARPDATLVLAGPREAPEQERVVALGMRSDVDAIMRAARVLVLPSAAEGLPNAMLEAIAVGLPVVAPPGMAPPELASAVDEADPTPAGLARAVLCALERPRADPPGEIRSYGLQVVAKEYALLYRAMIMG